MDDKQTTDNRPWHKLTWSKAPGDLINRLKRTRDGRVSIMFVRKWVIGYFKQMTTSIREVAFFGYRIDEHNHTKINVCLTYNSKTRQMPNGILDGFLNN